MVVTTILNADFTSLSPDDERFSKVTSILLDPSCSGSGLFRAEDTHPAEEPSNPTSSDLATRLRGLSTFQARLLKHALSFPSVKKVVYSTCSIHAEENEQVVMNILNETKGWRVLRREKQPVGLREWAKRGWVRECEGREGVAEGCVKCERGTDGTIGFFAVGFVRNMHAEEQNGKRADVAEGDDDDNMDEDDDEDEEEWQGIPS